MFHTQSPVPDNSGQFQKGQSGNPAGRPIGSRNKATLAAERLLEGALERLTGEAVELALSGNPQLLRLCISRLLPAARGRRVELDLPAADAGLDDIAAALAATMRAAAEGVISPLEAADLAGVIEVQRRTLETLDLQRRLAKLEAASKQIVAEARIHEQRPPLPWDRPLAEAALDAPPGTLPVKYDATSR
ncbi:MAG TPA: DUF5681 domain-containing protein [Stellaceae bacterium]|nr:DUF5681 domain-containing protein [Stellaceae bacterium]